MESAFTNPKSYKHQVNTRATATNNPFYSFNKTNRDTTIYTLAILFILHYNQSTVLNWCVGKFAKTITKQTREISGSAFCCVRCRRRLQDNCDCDCRLYYRYFDPFVPMPKKLTVHIHTHTFTTRISRT